MTTTQKSRDRAEDRQRPADVRSDVLIVREPIDGMRRFTVQDAPTTRDLVHGTPWSVPTRYKGQRSRSGVQFFAGTRAHVAFASLEERSLLLALDYQQTVAGILSQPFKLSFVRNEWQADHVPDYFVVRDDGSQEVWDVRPYDRIDGKLTATAALTREFCRDVGFGYFMFDGMRKVTEYNLSFLHAYSDARRYCPDQESGEMVLEHFTPESTLRDALAALGRPPRWIRMWTYHLLWIGQLEIDLARPLNDSRSIRASGT